LARTRSDDAYASIDFMKYGSLRRMRLKYFCAIAPRFPCTSSRAHWCRTGTQSGSAAYTLAYMRSASEFSCRQCATSPSIQSPRNGN
jgi:hypothetical protein